MIFKEAYEALKQGADIKDHHGKDSGAKKMKRLSCTAKTAQKFHSWKQSVSLLISTT